MWLLSNCEGAVPGPARVAAGGGSMRHPISITEASMFVTKTTARTRLQM
ncbi:MAG: hypothetical protein RLZZ536_2269, partial [Planctomycetota bacterium]